jgi:hypothetical protein
MWNRPDGHKREGTAEQLAGMLERILIVLLGGGALAVLVIAVLIIATMDASSKSQGGRFFVAVGALVALGFIDTQFARLMWRRYMLDMTGSGDYWRYRVVSSLLLLLAAAFLIGLALLLP